MSILGDVLNSGTGTELINFEKGDLCQKWEGCQFGTCPRIDKLMGRPPFMGKITYII